jgi:hypothetical protein
MHIATGPRYQTETPPTHDWVQSVGAFVGF